MARHLCPGCGERVIEEQFCPVHKLCDQCDHECFPPDDDELYEVGDEWENDVDDDDPDPTHEGWKP